jgi:hypothetical protein
MESMQINSTCNVINKVCYNVRLKDPIDAEYDSRKS